MIKILLADDNLLTLNQIAGMIAASGLDAAVVGQAMDGGKAAQLLFKLKPDVLIADVDMPVMNGVELSRFIQERALPVKMIALSNYDSFDYVRPIMKNGAVDYLLKHEVSPEALATKIAEACSQMEEDHRTAQREEVFSHLARETLLTNLLLGIRDNPVRRDMLLGQGEFRRGRFALLVMRITGFRILYHGHSEKEKSQLIRSVLNLCTSVCSTLGNGLCCPTEAGELAALFRYETVVSEQETRERTLEYASTLAGNLRRLLGVDTLMELCVFSDSLENIRTYYLRTKQALEAKGFRSQERQEGGALNLLTEKKLLDALYSADHSTIAQLVAGLIPEGRQGSADLEYMACQLLDMGSRFQREYGLPDEAKEPAAIREGFRRGIPTDRIRAAITDYLCGLTMAVEQHHKRYSPHVQNTIAYIHRHYTEDISLGDVAELNHISPVYLSTRFSTEVGETFIEYLTNYRIEAAKRLLRGAKVSVKEVYREAGFRNYNYFIRLFRERTGRTPLQFSKQGE